MANCSTAVHAALPLLFAALGMGAEPAPAQVPAPAPAPAAAGLTDAQLQAKVDAISDQADAIASDPFTHAFGKDAAPCIAALNDAIAHAADRGMPAVLHARLKIAILSMVGCDDAGAKALIPQLMADARSADDKKSVIQLQFEMAQNAGDIAAMKQAVAEAKQAALDDQLVEDMQEAIVDELSMPIGKPFLAFSLKDTAGKIHTLADYAGKVLLIDFWATWCGPCMHELPHVQAIYGQHHAQGLEILGISLDQEPGKLDAVVTGRKIAWPIVCDGQAWDGDFPKACHVTSIPHTFLIGKDGTLIGKELRGDRLEDAIMGQLGIAGQAASAAASTSASASAPKPTSGSAPFALAPTDPAPAPAAHAPAGR